MVGDNTAGREELSRDGLEEKGLALGLGEQIHRHQSERRVGLLKQRSPEHQQQGQGEGGEAEGRVGGLEVGHISQVASLRQTAPGVSKLGSLTSKLLRGNRVEAGGSSPLPACGRGPRRWPESSRRPRAWPGLAPVAARAASHGEICNTQNCSRLWVRHADAIAARPCSQSWSLPCPARGAGNGWSCDGSSSAQSQTPARGKLCVGEFGLETLVDRQLGRQQSSLCVQHHLAYCLLCRCGGQ